MYNNMLIGCSCIWLVLKHYLGTTIMRFNSLDTAFFAQSYKNYGWLTNFGMLPSVRPSLGTFIF